MGQFGVPERADGAATHLVERFLARLMGSDLSNRDLKAPQAPDTRKRIHQVLRRRHEEEASVGWRDGWLADVGDDRKETRPSLERGAGAAQRLERMRSDKSAKACFLSKPQNDCANGRVCEWLGSLALC